MSPTPASTHYSHYYSSAHLSKIHKLKLNSVQNHLLMKMFEYENFFINVSLFLYKSVNIVSLSLCLSDHQTDLVLSE